MNIRKYLSSIGRKGGKAGRGQSKRRPKEHYQRIAKARWAKEKGN